MNVSSTHERWGKNSSETARARQRGVLMLELVVSMGILAAVLIPLSLGFVKDRQLAKACYQQAVAMELVDGELEVLLAGEWKAFQPGEQPYPVRARAATNLPPGRFVLTLADQRVRLEWRPEGRSHVGTIVREGRLP